MQRVTLNARDFQGRAKVEAFQDAVSTICKLEFRPENLERFASQTAIQVLPGLITGEGQHSASEAIRTARLAQETGDNVMIHLPRSGGYTMQQKGGAFVECTPGVVYVDPNEVSGHVKFCAEMTDAFYVSIPRAALDPVQAALGRAMRQGHGLTPQWRMFLSYAEALHLSGGGLAPDQRARCVEHVTDLALMAFGATGEAAEIAAGRGVRAARLRAITADIEAHLASPELTPGWIARRHGISERYLRRLFAGEQTSFSDHVAQRRLRLVHRQLCDPGQAHRTIAEIALACGFGDLSWFNALFRRRYGESPSSVRARG